MFSAITYHKKSFQIIFISQNIILILNLTISNVTSTHVYSITFKIAKPNYPFQI